VLEDVAGDQPLLAESASGQIAGHAMKIHRGLEGQERIETPREERPDHAWIRIHPGASLRPLRGVC
jgi:hypothetical protein